jgi:hypothetical protein
MCATAALSTDVSNRGGVLCTFTFSGLRPNRVGQEKKELKYDFTVAVPYSKISFLLNIFTFLSNLQNMRVKFLSLV